MNKYTVRTIETKYFDEVIEASSEQEAEDKYNEMMCENKCHPVEDKYTGSWHVVEVGECLS